MHLNHFQFSPSAWKCIRTIITATIEIQYMQLTGCAHIPHDCFYSKRQRKSPTLFFKHSKKFLGCLLCSRGSLVIFTSSKQVTTLCLYGFTVTLSEVICRLHLFSETVLSSVDPSFTAELNWLQLPLWMWVVWVMPTLRGYPRRRVHPARTLEGELDICHADSGCHIFINLWKQKERFILFCSSVFSGKPMLFY